MAEGLSEEALKTIVDNVVARLQESNTAATSTRKERVQEGMDRVSPPPP